MPLPESSKSKMANYPSDLPCMHDEFVELLWDNGPVMQGPSSRPRKSSMFTMLPPSGIRVSEKDTKDNPFPKIGHFKVPESKVNNFTTSGPSSSFGINPQDDDIVPWINYPMEDPIHNDYCSEFLNDYSGVDLNSVHSQTPVVPAVRSGFLNQVGRDSHNTERGHTSASSRIRESQPLQLPTQLNSSTPCSKSSEIDLGMGNSSKAHNRERGSNGVMNFSHFFRPVTLVRENHQGVAKQEISNKTTFAASSNPVESPVIGSTSGLRRVFGTQDQLSSVQANTDLMPLPKPPKEVIIVDESKVICEGESSRKNNKYNTGNADSRSPERVQSSSFAASAALPEKRNDAVVVSSCASLSSSEDAESNDNKHRGKRKHQEGEESGYQSEDLEYESTELKKYLPVQGKSKKRSRAAEVHNLSEKRRRDRINERMRALQELIPNCNKTDKASMLDEAIEYLKSLQMQLQIMAMRSGLCMPPMMMQHMRAPTMASMGIGMGMGMGLSYGMGMYDVNVSPGCSFIPVQGPQFPCSSIPGSQGVHPLPTGSNNLQMFGIPGTGLPVPLPYRPPSTTTEDAKCSPDTMMNVGNQHEQNKTLEKT